MIGYLLTLILTLLFITPSLAQKSEAKSVGVVMSGGGAKGLYHIGVLEALEQSGVPIDYLSGTSMGAIIAALYASGYSPAEMRELALSGELERWVSGKIDANYGALFRRGSTLRNNDPTITLRMNPTKRKKRGEQNKKNKIPKSLINTTQIDMAIVELFTPAAVAADGDFSNLMVPFLCVASDVANDKIVVMKDGDLCEALRATMAIPIAFSPVMRESGEILYDGGIQDNFPWRSMQSEFNPDIIVGSVCGVDGWVNTDDFSLLDQAFYLSMNKTDYNLPENGVLIHRDVPVGILDFNNPALAINLGYWDTRRDIYAIRSQLGEHERLTPEFYEQRRREFRERSPELIFDSYNITGLSEHQQEYVKKYMSNTARQQRSGASIEREMTYPQLKQSLFSVLSSGEYATELPQTTYDSITQRYNFSIGLETKPSIELSLGGNLSSTPFNQIYIAAKYTTIERVARTIFGELYLGPVYSTGRLGCRIDFYHIAPIFIDTYFNFASKNLNRGSFGHLTEVDNTMGVKSSDSHASLGVGAPINQRSQIVLRGNGGVEHFEYSNSEYEQYNSLLYNFDNSRFKYMSGKAEVELSTIDNIYFSNSGSLLSLSAIGVLGKEASYADEYSTTSSELKLPTGDRKKFSDRKFWLGAKVNLIKYINLAPKSRFTLGVNVDAVYTTIPNMASSALRQMLMPAYQPISHMQMIYMPEFSAPRYIGVGLNPTAKLWRELYFRFGAYGMIRDYLDEESSTILKNKGLEMQQILQGSFIYNTTFGPLSLAVTKYNVDSWRNLYLTFNFGYTIFAPKGTFY